MLANPMLDKQQILRLHGMIKALGEQHVTPGINDLNLDERLGLMVDRELTEQPAIPAIHKMQPKLSRCGTSAT